MQKIKFPSVSVNTWLLGVILVVGAFLRFYQYSEFSLSNDELGALNRLRYSSVLEVIVKGMTLDTHPPLVEIFLYFWTRLLGDSELMLRFPFVICSIFSILFSYKIASRWFNPTTGLLVAAAMTFLEFPLIHSRMARPYSPGLLFVLMNVWYWHRLLFESAANKRWTAVLYGVTGGLCMTTHYICFLSALITGVTGLFFVRKNTLKYYLAGGGVALVLFLPCWNIFQYHFFEKKGLGGDAGWLTPPKPDFLWKYIFDSFNHSKLVFYFACCIFMFSLLLHVKTLRVTKFHIISAAWFLAPFLIAYYYSINRNPVLQNRILLFSFPFLLFFIFSFFSDSKTWIKSTVVLFTSIFFLVSTVWEKDFYATPHFEEFKMMAKRAVEFTDRYGEDNITRAVNLNDRYYIDHYLNRYGKELTFSSYKSDTRDCFLRFDSIIKANRTDYFFFAWSCINTPMEILPVIRKTYPYTADKEYFFSTEIYLFSRIMPENYREEPPRFSSLNDFEGPATYWGGNDSARTDTFRFAGSHCARIGGRFPFSPTFSIRVRELIRSVDDLVFVELKGCVLKTEGEIKICMSYEDAEGNIYSWSDMKFSNFIDSARIWKPVFLVKNVPEIRSGEDIVKIFVWNLSDSVVFIDDFRIWVEKGNPILFGKRDDQKILDDEE